MIGGEEEPAGLWLRGRGVRQVVPRVRAQVRRSGSHSHPFGRPPKVAGAIVGVRVDVQSRVRIIVQRLLGVSAGAAV